MRTASFLALALGLSGYAGTYAPGQEPPKGPVPKPQVIYGQFRELMADGKYDIAANFLQSFVESNPTEADFLAIEKKYGTTAFTQLRTVPKWSDDPATDKKARANVEEAVKRAREAGDRLLRDPARVQKYVRNLGRTYEERAFAEIELKRIGDFAVPFMVDELRAARDGPLAAGILAAIPKLEGHTVAGWIAALDGLTPDQQYGVLRGIAAREDALILQAAAQTDLTPFLWRVLNQPADQNPTLREYARDLLTRLRPGTKPAALNPAAELVGLGTAFYDHKARFTGVKTNPDGTPSTVPVWVWDATDPAAPKLKLNDDVPVGQAEEYYGLRYARWALERRADYEPAQMLILALAAERAIERAKFGTLAAAEPAVYKLLADAPAGVLTDLLDRALARKKSGLALSMLQVLGDRADRSSVPLMARALDYPDPQVQLVAANALLRSPAPVPPAARGRIVEILRRAAGADAGAPGNAKGTALVADPNKQRADATAVLLRGLGYDVEVFVTNRDMLRRVAKSSDFDVLLIDHHTPNPELIDTVGQLQRDPRAGNRPTFVVASTDRPRVPTFDQLVVRFAALIAATENEVVPMPPPFVPDPRMTPEELATARKRVQENRDGQFRTTAAQRMARLQRVIDTTGLNLTDTQRLLLNLRVELITYAVLAAEFPLSPESSPGTAEHLRKLRRQIDIQPPSPAYGAGTPTTDLLRLMERFEIDLAAVPTARERFERLYSRVDPADLGLPVETFRDPVLEARLLKTLRNYPLVRVIPEPHGRAALAGDLGAAQADPAQAPRDPAEKRAAQRTAIEWLRRMATGDVPGFDVKPAEPELRAALRWDDLAEPAVDAVSRFPSADAQRALLELALNTGKPLPLRTKAADAVIRHVQVNGKGIAKSLLDPLAQLTDVEPDPTLRAKLLTLSGLLVEKPATIPDPATGKPIPNPASFVNQLKGYAPPLLPAPPKGPDPKIEPEKKEPEKKEPDKKP